MSAAFTQYAVVRYVLDRVFFAILLSVDSTGRCRLISPEGGLLILEEKDLIPYQLPGTSCAVEIKFCQLGTTLQEVQETLFHFCHRGRIVLDAIDQSLTLPGQHYTCIGKEEILSDEMIL